MMNTKRALEIIKNNGGKVDINDATLSVCINYDGSWYLVVEGENFVEYYDANGDFQDGFEFQK